MRAEESQVVPIVIIRLNPGEIGRIAEIERGEHITRIFRVEE